MEPTDMQLISEWTGHNLSDFGFDLMIESETTNFHSASGRLLFVMIYNKRETAADCPFS